MNCCAIALALMLQTAGPEPPPDAPVNSGVYLRADGSGWIELNPAKIAEVRTKGLDVFIDSGGYTNLQMKGMLAAPQSSTRISERRPLIFVRGIGSRKEVMLIRLKREHNRRVFETASAEAHVENKRGFKRKDIRKTETFVYSDLSFSVAPGKPLEPGEYLLIFGDADAGYDFGIDLKKQP